jgi:hypothetical protein
VTRAYNQTASEQVLFIRMMEDNSETTRDEMISRSQLAYTTIISYFSAVLVPPEAFEDSKGRISLVLTNTKLDFRRSLPPCPAYVLDNPSHPISGLAVTCSTLNLVTTTHSRPISCAEEDQPIAAKSLYGSASPGWLRQCHPACDRDSSQLCGFVGCADDYETRFICV